MLHRIDHNLGLVRVDLVAGCNFVEAAIGPLLRDLAHYVGNLTYRSFRPLLKRTDLPRIRFHDLRHTCATLLLSKGTHPKIVQGMLGHANISMTMDTYSHVLPDMQEKAVSAMDDVLS
jgi:integrase